jgi:hypothetical protein
MNPPAHSLHSAPSGSDPAKKLSRNVRHSIDFAVPAAQEVLEHILGQMLYRPVSRGPTAQSYQACPCRKSESNCLAELVPRQQESCSSCFRNCRCNSRNVLQKEPSIHLASAGQAPVMGAPSAIQQRVREEECRKQCRTPDESACETFTPLRMVFQCEHRSVESFYFLNSYTVEEAERISVHIETHSRFICFCDPLLWKSKVIRKASLTCVLNKT